MPAESKNDLPPGIVLEDRFVLVSRIESGSMGTVYKALDQQRKDAGAEDPGKEAIVTSDIEGRVNFVSDSAKQLLGWRRKQIVGRSLGEDREAVRVLAVVEERDVARVAHEGTVRK